MSEKYDTSHFHLVSVGTVAADKNDNSKFIAAYMREALPFHEGPITAEHVNVQRKGIDADGIAYDITLQRGMTVKAEWIGDGNRVTSPNVRKGETVNIYTAGECGVYYWGETGRNNYLRRGERVIWAYNASSAPNTTDIVPTDKNCYVVTMDTKKGHITITTSMDNGEVASYVVQINGKKGNFTVTDHLQNVIQLDSTNYGITLKNGLGTYVAIAKNDINLYASQTLNLQCPQTIISGDLYVSGYTNMVGGSNSNV